MKRTLTYTVTEEFDNQRMDTLLRTHFQISGSLLKELKQTDDGLTVNGSRVRSIDKVHKGDLVSVTMHETASENIPPVKHDFKVIYEDEDILIVSKPAGMPTHTSMGNYYNTLSNAIMYYYAENGEERVFRAVNRLDKDTSGLMCIAKNRYIHARLCSAFGTKAVQRKYLAIVCGKCTDSGTIDQPISREAEGIIKRTVSDSGARAITHYKSIKTFGNYSLIELELETGRTHQIRVHMSYIGYPLLGDWLYGKEEKELFPRQALHSYYLKLTHPITGKILEFSDKLPDDMCNFIQKNEQYILK